VGPEGPMGARGMSADLRSPPGTRLRMLTAAVGELERIARRLDLAGVLHDLRDVGQRIASHRLQLVVVGQFKRGKSSVVNALLGGEVMPTGVLPVTSVATRVTWAPEAGAVVHYLDGRQEPVALDRLVEYVSESGNSENHKGIRSVDIRYPAPLLRDGVVLVDTPGVGSTISGNTDAAYAYLDEADAALAVVGGDPPLTAPEAEYLLQATQRAVRTFFVFNKIDAVPADEWREAMDFDAAQLGRVLGGTAPRIFPVSARWALEARGGHPAELWQRSGFAALQDVLMRFLREDRERVFVDASARRLAASAEAVRVALQVRRTALLAPLARMEEHRTRLQTHLSHVRSRRDTALAVFRDEVRKLGGQLNERAAQLRDQWTAELADAVAAWVRQRMAAGHRPTGDEIDEEVGRRITERILPWRQAQLGWLETAYGEVVSRCAAEFDALATSVYEAYAALAGAHPQAISLERRLTAQARFGLQLRDTPTFYPELSAITLSPLLPAAMAARVLERRARERAADLVDRNIGRVRYDIAYRLEEGARQLEGDLVAQLDQMQADLGRILDRAADDRERRAADSAGALRAVDDELRRVGQIASGLRPPDPGPVSSSAQPGSLQAAAVRKQTHARS
jgi:hypothetical protein